MLRHLGVKECIIEFLRLKPPGESYIWAEPVGCACGQLLAQHPDIVNEVYPGGWSMPEIQELNALARSGEHTFGDLLKRAEAAWPLHV